jgi:hypothetical protein
VNLDETETWPALASATDEAFAVTHRVRSYLQANCVQCHQPGGTTQAHWDARAATPLIGADIIGGVLVNDLGNPSNRVILPGSPGMSMLLKRISQLGSGHMPPLATSELNQEAITILSRWITNELVSLSLALSTNRLDYTENDGLRILDGAAALTFPDLGSLAGTRLTIGLVTNGAAEDRLELFNVGTGAGQVGISGASITFGGIEVGSFDGGTNGFTPLTITLGTNSTFEVAQAVLRHLAYENTSTTPSLLPRKLQITMETFYGATSTPVVMTIHVTAVPGPEAEFTNITLAGDGQVQLTFTGLVERDYRLEFSPDLNEWREVASIQTGQDGIGNYSGLPLMTNEPAGFYRLVWP